MGIEGGGVRRMSGAWQVIVFALIPLPLVLVTMLAIPWPTKIESIVLRHVEWFLFRLHLFNTPLLHFMLGVSLTALASQAWTTSMIYSRRSADFDSMSPNQQCGYRSMKLRHERNFWISFASSVVWFLLWKLFKIVSRNNELEKRLDLALVSLNASISGDTDDDEKGEELEQSDPQQRKKTK